MRRKKKKRLIIRSICYFYFLKCKTHPIKAKANRQCAFNVYFTVPCDFGHLNTFVLKN